jgi:hypothetical protein
LALRHTLYTTSSKPSNILFGDFANKNTRMSDSNHTQELPCNPEEAVASATSYEVYWDGLSDPTLPLNFPIWRKWLVVLTISSTALCVTCTSSLYTSTYGQLQKEFNCSHLVATLGLSLFIFGLGLGPMLLGPLSEFYGR